MRKLFVVLAAAIMASQPCFAVFHEFGLQSKGKEISYFALPQSSGASLSGALNYDQSLGGGRALEISYLSYQRWYLLPSDNAVQLGLLGKQKISEVGPLSITGVVGLGALYLQSIGASFSPNVGGILGVNLAPGVKMAIPVIASLYSDPAVLIDYSVGMSYAPPLLGSRQVLAGMKGVLMLLADPNRMAFANTTYFYGGLRINI